MEQTKEQKLLKVFSIIALCAGIIAILAGIASMVFGGVALGNSQQIVNETIATSEDIGKFGGIFLGAGIGSIIAGVLNLVNWNFLKKVSVDATQYKPAWILTLIGLAFGAISLIGSLVTKGGAQEIGAGVFRVALNGFVLYLINKVKSTVNA